MLRRLAPALLVLLAAGCAEYPTARDLKRVEAVAKPRLVATDAIPGGEEYLRQVGEVIAVEGVVTAIDDRGPVLLTIDGRVLCAFAAENEAAALACRVGSRVAVKGILRYDPDRRGWLSPAAILPPASAGAASAAATR